MRVRLYTDTLNLKNLQEKEVKTEKDSRWKSLKTFPNAKRGVPALDTVAGVAVRRWLISNTSLMVGFRGIRSLLARVRTWQMEAGYSHSELSVVYTALAWISWAIILFCSHSLFHLAIGTYTDSLHTEMSHISPICGSDSHVGFNHTCLHFPQKWFNIGGDFIFLI